MALYDITGPNGQSYSVEAPDDATEEQIYAYVNQNFDVEQPANTGGLSDASSEYEYESEETSGARDVGDVATGLVSGTVKAAGAVVGLGSLVPGLHYVADPLSAWLQDRGQDIDEALLSDRQQEINQELSARLKEAAGELGPDASYSDYFDAMVSQGGEAGSFVADHPGQIANLIATSVPYIFGGGVITKGVKAGAKGLGLKKVSEMGGVVGAAVGEGSITAGEVTKNIIEKTGTSGEYSTDRLAAIPAGLGTGAISLLGGRIANKAGVADIDTAITNKITGESTDLLAQVGGLGNKAKRVGVGSTIEGGEELVQGAQEKVFENLGTGEHLLKDVGGEAVMGAFAGAGQGAGMNVIQEVVTKSPLSAAAQEEQDKIKAEQAQALVDEEFMADASAIGSAEDQATFVEKWTAELGATEEEVLGDPRFGRVKEEQALVAQEDIIKEKRRVNADSFPNEKLWEQENQETFSQNQRIDIANETSELGATFIAWQKENDLYDKDDETINLFLDDIGASEMEDVGRDNYFAALDAHADFREQSANRTEEEIAQSDTTSAALIEARNEALSSGDMAALGAVEKSASEALDPAEWAMAKRNSAAPKKGKKAAKVSSPVVQATGTPTQGAEPVIAPSPYQVGSKRDAAFAEASEALGDLEAHPELTKIIESKKGVYGAGETKFSRALAKAKLQKRLVDMSEVAQDADADTKGASSDATKNLGANISSAMANGDIDITNTQVKVLDVLLDAMENDTLGEYIYGDGKVGADKIAKAAGLKGRSTALSAVNSVMGYFTEFAGEGTKQQLKETKLRTDEGKTLKESASTEGTAQDTNTDAEFLVDGNEAVDENEVVTNDRNGDTSQASAADAGFGFINTAGGSQAKVDAPDAAGKEWVDKTAEAKGKVEDKARLDRALKKQADMVAKVLASKEAAELVTAEWEANKPDNAPSFDSLPVMAKFVWLNAIQDATVQGDPTMLVADAAEITKKFSKQTKGKTNEKTNSKPKAKSKKVVKGKRQADAGTKINGDATDTSRKQSGKPVRKTVAKKPVKPVRPTAKKVSKPAGKPNKKVASAVVILQEEAASKLGDDWMLDHPQLMKMLEGLKYKAFQEAVTKLEAKSKESENEFKSFKASVGSSKGDKATQSTFEGMFKKLLGAKAYKRMAHRVHYYANAEAAAKDLNMDMPKGVKGGVLLLDGEKHIVFITDAIDTGTEMSLFMHEVGGHIGMASIMNEDEMADLAEKISGWAELDDGSLESTVAKAAEARVQNAIKEGAAPVEVRNEEWIAYFLEEAVKAGVTPTSVTKAGELVDVVLTKFRNAARKFVGFMKGESDNFTTQNLIDMAYGGAKMDLAGNTFFFADGKERPVNFSVDPKKNKKDVSNTRKAIRATFGDTGIQHWETLSAAAKKASSYTKFLHQLIEENRIKMPSATLWMEAVLRAEATRNEIKQHVEGIAVQAREMADERLAVVNKFIADSTLNQVWGYDPKVKGKKSKVDKDAKIAFDALSTIEQKLVRDIFDHGRMMADRKRAISKSLGLGTKFFQSGAIDGPYAPLKRFGRYVTELKSQALLNAEKSYALAKNKINKKRLDNLRAKEEHYVVSFFDTKGEATRFRDYSADSYASATTGPRDITVADGNSADHKVLSKVLGAMQSADIDPVAYDSVKKLVTEMYMSSLDDTNARESQAKREGVAGFNKNMVRSFLSHARAEANLIAQMEHGSDISAALVEAKQESRADPEHLGEIYNLIVSHYSEMVNGKETPIQNVVAAVNTVWMLTSSVGYHFTNATQPTMVSLPVLAATFGDYVGTWKQLAPMFGVGYQIARDIVTFQEQNGKFLHRQAEVDMSKVPPEYLALMAALQERKLLDVGLEQDLAEFTRLNTGSDVLNKASESASNVTHRLYQVARVVEMYNRVATAVAAHDMALKKPDKIKHLGMSTVEFAIKIVQDTQGNFDQMDAPLVIKKLPKLTVQYRKYQVMMGWAYANAFKQAFKGQSKEEKAVGAKTIGYLLMHAGIFGGVRGLPFIGLVAATFAMFSDGEEPEDIERIIHKYVDNEDLANLISRGLPSILGIDMSTKLSQDKIFHPAPYIDFDLSQEGLRDAGFGMVLGPTASTASNFVRSFEYAEVGNTYRAIEYALPKGIRSIMESYRLSTEGYTRKNGEVIAGPEQFNKISLIANAVGIPASDVSKLKWTIGQQYELVEYFSEAQADIRTKYLNADKANDFKTMNTLEKSFDDLQDRKDAVRPFFNDAPSALRRTSIKSLVGARSKQERSQWKSRERLNTD